MLNKCKYINNTMRWPTDDSGWVWIRPQNTQDVTESIDSHSCTSSVAQDYCCCIFHAWGINLIPQAGIVQKPIFGINPTIIWTLYRSRHVALLLICIRLNSAQHGQGWKPMTSGVLAVQIKASKSYYFRWACGASTLTYTDFIASRQEHKN